MSIIGDDEEELKSLVTSSLQSSGVLGKIKAELRSNVFLAFEGQSELKAKSRHTNHSLDDFLTTSEGRLAAYLVREFLEFFNLQFTLSVFEPEGLEGRIQTTHKSRASLIESIGFPESFKADTPLLSEILRLSKVNILRSETPSRSEDNFQKSEDESSMVDETPKSRDKLSITPTQSVTPDSSLTNLPVNNVSVQNLDQFESTFVVSKTDLKPTNLLSSLSDLPKLGGQSSLGDLPPLSTGNRLSPVKLGALKKIPSVEKPINQKPLDFTLPISKAKKETAVPKPAPTPDMDDEEIEEEMDEFMNSSVSASEDFTKDESASEAVSLHGDYVEKLS